MKLPGSIAPARVAFALLAACAAIPSAASSAGAATPSLLWSDARQVAVRCLVQSNTTRDAAALQESLCARVRDLAGLGAPYPVKQAAAGDPVLIAPGTVTLLVHASVETTPRGRIIAFTIRPHRPAEGGEVPFGTAPRAIETRSTSMPRALSSALAEALAEILPWQRPSSPVARPL